MTAQRTCLGRTERKVLQRYHPCLPVRPRKPHSPVPVCEPCY
eukprot:SAG31_NODE_44894_length_261_cov_0.611111_1_plen_41_part_10